jgi:Peptidase_C39 like family
MAAMPRSPNPNLGFRGNPDGQQGNRLADYGVYAGPIQAALQHYGYHSEVLMPGNDAGIRSYVSRGWPVITWVSYNLQPSTPRLASYNGVQFVLVPHEHAVLVIGYDRRSIVANDPWTGGHVRYYWSEFNRSWGYFGNMVLAIEPCPVPQPIPDDSVRLRNLSSDSVNLTWAPSVHAVRYSVAVHVLDPKRILVFSGTQTARRVTISSPVPGGQYQIAIKPVSTCGGSPATTRVVVQLPDILPTPTPTASPEATISPTSSPTPATTPTPAITATTTPTAKP